MSKIAKQIHQELASINCYLGRGPEALNAIERVLAGKIISKSEVDALRKDAANMQSAQDAYNYTESLNSALRRENLKLKQENTNLKLDAISLKSFSPIYFAADWAKGWKANWSDYNVKFTTTPGQIVAVNPCGICGKLEPPNATHGHSDFEKFVRRLKFWR